MKEIKLALMIFLCCTSFVNSQETGTVMDIDGNIYTTVKIGDQWWMVENLKVTRYQNGDAIVYVTDNSDWTTVSTGAFCNYDNDEANVATYGRLYNWHAVNDSRNIAPAGWHVPGNEEWQTMVDHLGGDTIAGGKMKTTGTIEEGTGLWTLPNAGATNESGFSALPAGYHHREGSFIGITQSAYYWSFTESSSNYAYYRYLNSSGSGLYGTSASGLSGFSVRCVQDQDNSGIQSRGEIKSFELNQNYPNPFNAGTTIGYSVPADCHVKITVHNIRGEQVITLVDEEKSAGAYRVSWAANNIANGLYFYRLQADHINLVKKLILQK